MKNNKFKLIGVIVLVILLGVGVYLALRPTIFNSKASNVTVTFSPDTVTKNVGDDFIVSLTINPDGSAVVAEDVEVQYDPAVLELLGPAEGAPSAFGSYIITNPTPGVIKIVGFSYNQLTKTFTAPVTGSTIFATIPFRAKSQGNTNLQLIKTEVAQSGSSDNVGVAGGQALVTVQTAITAPTKPVIQVSCVNNNPIMNISWTGAPGVGGPQDLPNAGKAGTYVDIGESPDMTLVYNKFIPGTAVTTTQQGFVLANAGLPTTGSPLVLTPGQPYTVRVFNGEYSPNADPVIAPSCVGNQPAKIEQPPAGWGGLNVTYAISPASPQAGQPVKVSISQRDPGGYIGMLVDGNFMWSSGGGGEDGTFWNLNNLAPGNHTVQLFANCDYENSNCSSGTPYNPMNLTVN